MYNYQFQEKTIFFCPMHHLGHESFYDDAKRIIYEKKSEGYVVLYEKVKLLEQDSLKRDILERKLRKVKGIGGSYDDYTDVKLFEGFMGQPSNEEMGIEESDIWADVSYTEFVDYFESSLGELVLDSIDLITGLDEEYVRALPINKTDRAAVIVEFRNDVLFQEILDCSSDKILIVYGAGHRKGIEKRMKKTIEE